MTAAGANGRPAPRAAAADAKPSIKPDMDEAERFLGALDPTTTQFTFQTFDDDKARREARKAEAVKLGRRIPDPFAKVLHGILVVPDKQDDDLVVVGTSPTPSIVNALPAAADSRDLILLTKGGKRRALLVGAHLVDEVLRGLDLGPLMPDDAYITIKLDDDLDRQLAEVDARDEVRRQTLARFRGDP